MEDPNPSCIICLNSIQGTERWKCSNCFNSHFHLGCAEKWISQSSTCPLCRCALQAAEIKPSSAVDYGFYQIDQSTLPAAERIIAKAHLGSLMWEDCTYAVVAERALMQKKARADKKAKRKETGHSMVIPIHQFSCKLCQRNRIVTFNCGISFQNHIQEFHHDFVQELRK